MQECAPWMLRLRAEEGLAWHREPVESHTWELRMLLHESQKRVINRR